MKRGDFIYLDFTLFSVILATLFLIGNYIWMSDSYEPISFIISFIIVIFNSIFFILFGIAFISGYQKSILLLNEKQGAIGKSIHEVMDSLDISPIEKAKCLGVWADNVRKMESQGPLISDEVSLKSLSNELNVPISILQSRIQKIFQDILTTREFPYMWKDNACDTLVRTQKISRKDGLKIFLWIFIFVLNVIAILIFIF
jgi:hypothetical protein